MGMKPITSKQILKAIGCDKLKLYKGEGYWWFQFDDYKMTARYDTKSVYVMYLKDLPLDQWIKEGKEFVAEMNNPT